MQSHSTVTAFQSVLPLVNNQGNPAESAVPGRLKIENTMKFVLLFASWLTKFGQLRLLD